MLTNAVFLLRSTMEGLVVTRGVSVRADGTDKPPALETVFVICVFSYKMTYMSRHKTSTWYM